MRLVFTCLACSFATSLAAADPAAAQHARSAATAPITVVSLPDAIHIALANNPDSLATYEDVRAANGALVQSHAFENPTLFVNSMGENVSPTDVPMPNQFGFTWTIPIREARPRHRRGPCSARCGGRDAHRHAAGSRTTVETAFISVLLDQAQLDFAKQDQAGLREAVDSTRSATKTARLRTATY